MDWIEGDRGGSAQQEAHLQGSGDWKGTFIRIRAVGGIPKKTMFIAGQGHMEGGWGCSGGGGTVGPAGKKPRFWRFVT